MDLTDDSLLLDAYIVSIDGPVLDDALPPASPKRLMLIGAIPDAKQLAQAVEKHGREDLRALALAYKAEESLSLLMNIDDVRDLNAGASFTICIGDLLQIGGDLYPIAKSGKPSSFLPPQKVRLAAHRRHEAILNIMDRRTGHKPRGALRPGKPKKPAL